MDDSCDYYQGHHDSGTDDDQFRQRDGNDQTVLVDNLMRVARGQGYFHCKERAGESLRITGITFTGDGGFPAPMYNGAIRVGGKSSG